MKTSDMMTMIRHLNGLMEAGKFKDLDNIFLTATHSINSLDIDYMMTLIRTTCSKRWFLPNWFIFRDAMKDELTKRKQPTASLMAGLFDVTRPWGKFR